MTARKQQRALPLPADEQRLAALRRLGIAAEPARFDVITQTVALALDAPTVAISLIDDEDQWLLSCYGSIPQAIPRKHAFCAEGLRQRTPFVVEDARRDPRFARDPLVTGPPHIGFYASYPLSSLDGAPLGTLSVLDYKPRQFDPRAAALLRGLAQWAQHEIDARGRERVRLEAARHRLIAPGVHRLRGALTSIHGFSDFLLTQDPGEESRREALGIIHEQANLLKSLLDELIELFDVEVRGERDLQIKMQPLAPLIRDALAPLGIDVTLDLDPTLKALAVDRGRLQAALSQLAGLAAQPHASHPVHIKLAPAQDAGFAQIDITHRSTKIPPSELERAFEPFYRLTRAAGRETEPSGLALTKDIAELHGGSIAIHAADDALTITLLLPNPR